MSRRRPAAQLRIRREDGQRAGPERHSQRPGEQRRGKHASGDRPAHREGGPGGGDQGPGGVGAIQRRRNQHRRQCPGQRRQRRFGVPDLSDEDHVRVLPDDVLQRGLVRTGVDPDLALLDDRELVVMHDLDRIFDRHDMGAT